MDNAEELKKEIWELEDRIRTAPPYTPHKTVFEWYTEIDRLKAQLAEADLKGTQPVLTAEKEREAYTENAEVPPLGDPG